MGEGSALRTFCYMNHRVFFSVWSLPIDPFGYAAARRASTGLVIRVIGAEEPPLWLWGAILCVCILVWNLHPQTFRSNPCGLEVWRQSSTKGNNCRQPRPSWKAYSSSSSQIREQLGARSGAVGWGTALQPGRSRFRFPIMSLELFIDIILPVALWYWGRLSL